MRKLGPMLGSGMLLIVIASAAVRGITPQHASQAHVMVTPDDTEWAPAPPSLPSGAQAAVLEGDPAKSGAFTMRLKLPDGYRIPPHFHPADEHVTVIEGTFVMGLGDKFDESAGRPLRAGSFAMMPAGTRHFVWTKGATVVQLHGTGPWWITYVNASDDPRKKGGR